MRAALLKVGKAFAKAVVENAALGPLTIAVVNHWQLAGYLAAIVNWASDNLPTYLILWAADVQRHWRLSRERQFLGCA